MAYHTWARIPSNRSEITWPLSTRVCKRWRTSRIDLLESESFDCWWGQSRVDDLDDSSSTRELSSGFGWCTPAERDRTISSSLAWRWVLKNHWFLDTSGWQNRSIVDAEFPLLVIVRLTSSRAWKKHDSGRGRFFFISGDYLFEYLCAETREERMGRWTEHRKKLLLLAGEDAVVNTYVFLYVLDQSQQPLLNLWWRTDRRPFRGPFSLRRMHLMYPDDRQQTSQTQFEAIVLNVFVFLCSLC